MTLSAAEDQLAAYTALRQERGLPAIEHLEAEMGYIFVNRALLFAATTHSSAAQESNQQQPVKLDWNERLEFLGDAVLGLTITTELMERAPDLREGELSRIRAGLIKASALTVVASEIRLGTYLFLGASEAQPGGTTKASILADAVEAVIGAVFLDGGFAAAQELVRKLFKKLMAGDLQAFLHADYKSKLQELIQGDLKQTPSYELVAAAGPAHARHFEVAVRLNARHLATGLGSSKKRASQDAARQAYDVLQGERQHDL